MAHYALYIIITLLVVLSLVGGIIYVRMNSTKMTNLKKKIRTLVENTPLTSPPPQREIPLPLTYVTSLPTSKSKQEIIDMMNRYEVAGILFSTDPADATILQLERKLMFPDMQTLGDEKNDYSQYYYRVRDKDGFFIELNHTLYNRLVDGDIVASVPGYEGVGTFEADIYDRKFTLQIMP